MENKSSDDTKLHVGDSDLPFNDRFWNQKDLLMRSKKISMGTDKMQTEHLILKNMPIWIEMLNFQQQH